MIVVIFLFLIAIAVTVSLSRNLLFDVILLGVFSFFMAIFYSMMMAPDVAITEAAVNSAIATIFMLIALLYCRNKEEIMFSKNYLYYVLVLMLLLVLLLPIVNFFPEFGSFDAPVNNEIAQYYISETVNKLGFTNIVTGVLASFRGFDTLIETIVIFTAANTIYMLVGDNGED